MSWFKNHDYYKHVHLEGRKGTALEASDYCKKEDPNPIIHGKISTGILGERNDLSTILHISQPIASFMQLLIVGTCHLLSTSALGVASADFV